MGDCFSTNNAEFASQSGNSLDNKEDKYKNCYDDISSVVQQFEPIHLDEMDEVKLMNRTDTKFVFRIDLFPEILREALSNYKALEIHDTRMLGYQTDYFDTPDFEMYTKHHNGKLNRYKIRRREYLIDGINFLEVKFKTNKGRTVKKRIMAEAGETVFKDKTKKFLSDTSPFNPDCLEKKLTNSFTRITLAHKTDKERITLDLNLGFDKPGTSYILPFMVIAEVKQEGYSMNSTFIRLLKKHHITPTGMSKYCIGTVLLNPELKRNRFKQKLLTLKKLSGNDSSFIEHLY